MRERGNTTVVLSLVSHHKDVIIVFLILEVEYSDVDLQTNWMSGTQVTTPVTNFLYVKVLSKFLSYEV